VVFPKTRQNGIAERQLRLCDIAPDEVCRLGGIGGEQQATAAVKEQARAFVQGNIFRAQMMFTAVQQTVFTLDPPMPGQQII